MTFLKLIIFFYTFEIATQQVHLIEWANRDRLVAARAIETVSCNSDNLNECNTGADNAMGSQFFETSIFGIARLFKAGIAKFFSLKVMRTHPRFLKL